MKIIYNNTELQNNIKKYSTLDNKPSLNGITLVGNTTLDALSLYDKFTTKKLILAISQIRLVSEMPAEPEVNMTYYVGPDERGLYDVILVDDSRTLIDMGTTQFGQYKSGPGVNVDATNKININTDSVSTYIDSEGNLASSLDGEALPAFTGATASTAGTKGLVPKPVAGQHNALLRGDSSWADIIDYIYPVGSMLLTDAASVSPNTLFSGTTWELLSSGYALLNTADGGGVTSDDIGIPNIEATMRLRPLAYGYVHSASDAFYSMANWHQEVASMGIKQGGYWNGVGEGYISFDASKSNGIYGKSNTVQAPAITVCAWRRTA